MISNSLPFFFFFPSIRFLFLFFFSCILSTTHVYIILSTSSPFSFSLLPQLHFLEAPHSFILSSFIFPLLPLDDSRSSPALLISSLFFFHLIPEALHKSLLTLYTSASWLIWSKLLADLNWTLRSLTTLKSLDTESNPNPTLWVRSFFVFLFFFFLSVFLRVYGCLAVGLCYLISVVLDCGLCFG